MIFIELPARMRCDESGCGKSLPVQLLLNAAGLLSFTVKDESVKYWQIGVDATQPLGPVHTRCPDHGRVIETVATH